MQIANYVPAPPLSPAEEDHLCELLHRTYLKPNSPMNTRLQFVLALAAEANLSFDEICSLTLCNFNFIQKMIFPNQIDGEPLSAGASFEDEVVITFCNWMMERTGVPDNGCYGVLICTDEPFDCSADYLTPEDLIDEFRQFLVNLDPESPYSSRMARFGEADLACFSF